MGLTTAMFTGLSGLNANQFSIDTIGNNIANVNTTAFQGSRAMFENQFSLLLNAGTGPSDVSGGVNPSQLGLGTTLATVQRNFTPGSIEATGVPTDMAIEGDGFFVLQATSEQQAFTRDGTFSLDSENYLVSTDGYHVQGYGTDDDFNVIPGILTDLQIPLGTLTAARATETAEMEGNLNASGTIGTQGTILQSQAFEEGPGAPATETTLLTDLYDTARSAVTPLFAEGDEITLSEVRRGGREIPEETFTVTATSTLGDFITFLQNSAGLNTDAALPGDAGIQVSTAAGTEGMIILEGNAGEENALSIDLDGIRSTNANFTTPFAFTETQEANGESVYTSFIAYDSLGTPIQINMTVALEGKSNTGTTWRYYAESYNDTDASPVLGTGTLEFDNDGRLVGVDGESIQITRENTGAVNPLQVTLDFTGLTGLTTENSAMVMSTQDGYGTGTLTGFSVGKDGVISGAFSNGLTQTLGQIALATVSNPEGLVSEVNNLYFVGPNSGQPLIAPPGTLGAGQVVGSSLELSNVDLTREFLGLITAQTAFSASGRVISTSNDLLNELMLIAR